MLHGFLLLLAVNLFVFLMGFSLGRSVIRLQIRKEDNRKKELELQLQDKRAEVLAQGKQMSGSLEELLYRAQIHEEIDRLIRKSRPE